MLFLFGGGELATPPPPSCRLTDSGIRASGGFSLFAPARLACLLQSGIKLEHHEGVDLYQSFLQGLQQGRDFLFSRQQRWREISSESCSGKISRKQTKCLSNQMLQNLCEDASGTPSDEPDPYPGMHFEVKTVISNGSITPPPPPPPQRKPSLLHSSPRANCWQRPTIEMFSCSIPSSKITQRIFSSAEPQTKSSSARGKPYLHCKLGAARFWIKVEIPFLEPRSPQDKKKYPLFNTLACLLVIIAFKQTCSVNFELEKLFFFFWLCKFPCPVHVSQCSTAKDRSMLFRYRPTLHRPRRSIKKSHRSWSLAVAGQCNDAWFLELVTKSAQLIESDSVGVSGATSSCQWAKEQTRCPWCRRGGRASPVHQSEKHVAHAVWNDWCLGLRPQKATGGIVGIVAMAIHLPVRRRRMPRHFFPTPRTDVAKLTEL